MKRKIVFCLSALICAVALQGIVQAQLTGAQRNELQKDLERLLLNKSLKAKVQFPAWKDGIDLKTDGSWDKKWQGGQIQMHGVGLDLDEAATITAVKLQEKHIEIHLNGGGAGSSNEIITNVDRRR